MSLVPCNKSSQNKNITLNNIFQDRLPFLGIREISALQGLEKGFAGFFIKHCRRVALTHHKEGAIIILSSGAKEKLMALSDPLRQEYFAHLILCKTALLIFAQSMTLPACLKKQLRRHRLPTAISSLHENLLESRIKAILQEKIKKYVTVHGVALEYRGRGILIRGASGIGKTTTALQVISAGYAWIADDRAVIQKKPCGKLFVSGHRKIKKYFHTGETGIMVVDQILNTSQIKNKAELAFVIDVIRTGNDDSTFQLIETEIMETRLPLIQVSISRSGYLDQNLLTKGIQKLNEVG